MKPAQFGEYGKYLDWTPWFGLRMLIPWCLRWSFALLPIWVVAFWLAGVLPPNRVVVLPMALAFLPYYYFVVRRVWDVAGAVSTLFSLTVGLLMTATIVVAAVIVSPWYTSDLSLTWLATLSAIVCFIALGIEQIIDW